MMNWFSALWNRLVSLFRLPSRQATAAPVDVSPVPAPSWTAPVIEEAEAISLNRQARRRLERARRRRDKLVTPKLDHIEAITERDPPPTKDRKKKKPKKPEIGIVDDPNDIIIADELIEGDGQGEVLFEEPEFYGEFNFRDSILDQLDRYWFYLKRMRCRRDQTFEFYQHLGAVIVPLSATGSNLKFRPFEKMTAKEIEKFENETKLTPWFNETRPSWGCIALGANQLVEQKEKANKIWFPKFANFVKYHKPPPEIQMKPGTGDVYKLTVWWDPTDSIRGRHHKYGTPNDIPIFVSKDGKTILPLKQIETRMVRVGRQGNNFDYSLIPQRAWYFPKAYELWALDHGLSIELHLAHLFCTVVKKYEYSQLSTARVSVSKDDLTASFGINPRRLAYFFRDRDIIVTVNGQRKRILHYVRPHVREDGTAVKAHFRGVREFTWAGYNVYITIPGRDHILLPEFNVGMSDEFWHKKKDNMIEEKEIGRMLADVVHGVPIKDAVRRAKTMAQTAKANDQAHKNTVGDEAGSNAARS
jgi:hypothetical protein